MYKINWKIKAYRQLAKLKDAKTRENIYDAVGELKDFPHVASIKKLINHQYGYRLTVGRYRVLFDANRKIQIIDIQEVKKRDEHTY